VFTTLKWEASPKPLHTEASLLGAMESAGKEVENAGTEVGSDLIILQKNSNKLLLTPEEQAFQKSRTLSNGINVNNYFQGFSRVVQTKGYPDKDLYGRPGMIFIHEGGVQGIAKDLENMLSDDFSKYLDRDLYRNNSVFIQSKVHVITPKEEIKPQQSQQVSKVEQQPLMTLYDLWGPAGFLLYPFAATIGRVVACGDQKIP
jgi:hypothetical protein